MFCGLWPFLFFDASAAASSAASTAAADAAGTPDAATALLKLLLL